MPGVREELLDRQADGAVGTVRAEAEESAGTSGASGPARPRYTAGTRAAARPSVRLALSQQRRR